MRTFRFTRTPAQGIINILNKITVEQLRTQPQSVLDLTLLSSKTPLHLNGIKVYISDIGLAICIEYEEMLLSIKETELPSLFRIGHCTQKGTQIAVLNMPTGLTGILLNKSPYTVLTDDGNSLTFCVALRNFESSRGSNKRSGVLFKGRISLPLYDNSTPQQILTAFEAAAANCGIGNVRLHEGTDKVSAIPTSTLYFQFEPVERSTHPSMADVEWSPLHCQALTQIRLPSGNFMQATFSSDLLEEYHLCWCCLKDTRKCTGSASVTDAIRKRKSTAAADRGQMKQAHKQRMRARIYLESLPPPRPTPRAPPSAPPHPYNKQGSGSNDPHDDVNSEKSGSASPPLHE